MYLYTFLVAASMKILYRIRCFVFETNDKKYIHIKKGDLISIDGTVGVFISISDKQIELDRSEKYKSLRSYIDIKDIKQIEVIEERPYEGNYE